MIEKILIADDDTSVVAALQMLLKSQGFEVVSVTTPDALLEQAKKQQFSVALIDLNYQNDTTSGHEGMQMIAELKQIDEKLPIVVMTGYSSVDIAVDAMKAGAADFVQKPWGNERLLHTLRTQIQLHSAHVIGSKLASENTLLKDQLSLAKHAIVAESESMKAMLLQLKKLAKSDMSILLTGENGTGKSMFAEYIHQYSMRHKQAFIAVNMGAITESLFESEMFGHMKGAFTDAKEARIGRFELAQAGTIFLDEIANIGISQQAKLLRVLEERQFERVGSSKTQQLDLRIISATNANVDKMIVSGDFRQDLYYRLNTITLHIPALRERKADIIPLAQQFLTQHAHKYRIPVGTFSAKAAASLEAYDWPGNIRELSHIIERALFLCTGDCIEVKDLGFGLNEHQDQASTTGADGNSAQTSSFEQDSLDDIEKGIIVARMKKFTGNPIKTAESLGLSRSAYYRRLEKYNLT
ncbi:sigma-54-dependent transcriptional regulator [Glaciecola petra]|uniref:Sigma-54 dependent transcriptional regulator n=1 Tax=Glaciecola petra TaxID=3075602 RepID=A0ABU2ZUK0_9ALTE|nr:sigma-54 dependent transcriptional regulator [Aestuariibacter sp. P117]MDT0596311.1 sigma-54 dependent transcriptional regulator [Aestuariibacter sp. P117]